MACGMSAIPFLCHLVSLVAPYRVFGRRSETGGWEKRVRGEGGGVSGRTVGVRVRSHVESSGEWCGSLPTSRDQCNR